jgi:hypothetical protein
MAELHYGRATCWASERQNVMLDVELNEKEQKASDAIVAAMKAVYELSEGEGDFRTPWNFNEEVVPAIHRLQMFVLMHWAHRIHPGHWSDWFHAEGPPPWIPSLNIIERYQSASNLTP